MCGIIGVVGASDALPILLEGLERLEYRGYDSAGVALVAPGRTWRARSADGTESVAHLEASCAAAPAGVGSGIGHTRWATHGAPGEHNAHPHVDCAGDIALIHNGIIENHAELAVDLRSRGHIFTSATDTEVLAHRIEELRKEGSDLLGSVRATLHEVRGAFALAVMDAHEPDVIIAARRISPLIVGTSTGATYLASDVPAILDRAERFFVVDDDQIVRLTPDGFSVTDLDGNPVTLRELDVDWDLETAQKGGFDDFMTKEMNEQPDALRATLLDRVNATGEITLDELSLTNEQIAHATKVVLVACGSSFHAAMVAKYAIERWARISVEVDIASEFRYRDPVVDNTTLVIGVSQSGETIDTIQALREAKSRGAMVVAVANVVDSSMAREADAVLYTRAGLEVCVASTKAVLAQVAALEVLALRLAQVRGVMSTTDIAARLAELQGVPELVARTLDRDDAVASIASALRDARDFFFLGRHVGFPVALEGALKLKEISYLHAEGYPAGELKHGPLALIEPGVVVVAIATDDELREKLLANIAEVKSRGATVVAVCSDGDSAVESVADYVAHVPRTDPLVSPLVDIVVLQQLAYHLARGRGLNVDRPRNLAKTVTVE
ncbi:MAG: glutamine--fructose-6-phosphate transaminase (isomerizing) [Acidobacteria bacterium]|nr:glutamine--fructose-6-phosphate transaminase (isomerizing) [Acidobacteriota bacterium]